MAMGRQKDGQGDLMVSWSEMPRSPGHVFYDRLQSVLIEGGFDAFAEASCRPYYAARMGAPSVPPGRYFRMHLVGYFEGIDSERGLEWRCSDSLSLRAFLRLGSRDRVPDHSWLSRSRTRLPHEVHAAVFDWVLVLIAEAGLIKGERIGVDAWRYFRSAHAHRGHAGGTGGLAKRPDGFRRRIPHLGVRAGKSHLINGLLGLDVARMRSYARPRNTSIARLNRTTSSSSRRPMRSPSLSLETVVSLSTMSREGTRMPFHSLGVIGRRNSGASVGSVVKTQIVIEAIPSNRSSWAITAGRGLPE